MGKVIVVEFVTADGIIEDPDGSSGAPGGGWAFHAGPDVFAGDKFGVGAEVDGGVMLFGRRTWEMFSTRWPNRTGEFPDVMNRSRKVVATTSLRDLSAWNNSSVLDGPLADGVADLARTGAVVVVGSMSIVRALAEADMVDEYRLVVVPTVVGTGERLFPDAGRPTTLTLQLAEQRGATIFVQYDVDR